VFCVQPEVSDSEKQAFIDLAGADGEIDAFELKDILNKEFKKGYEFAPCLFINLILFTNPAHITSSQSPPLLSPSVTRSAF